MDRQRLNGLKVTCLRTGARGQIISRTAISSRNPRMPVLSTSLSIYSQICQRIGGQDILDWSEAAAQPLMPHPEEGDQTAVGACV
jgi:hypothetical protein